MKSDNPNHQLRLSIDLRTVKDHEFTAQLYLRYSTIPSLGLSTFRSASIPISNSKVQTQLKDCFASGYFQASASTIPEKLNQKIDIQLWHNDRFKKDLQLGIAVLQLNKILDMPLRQTSESYARVLDTLLPIDQMDTNGKPIKTVGSLRVITYLQDLGPSDKLQQRGFNVKDLLEEVQQEVMKPVKEQEPPERMAVQNAGLNELEKKVVWELQTWKKAEEAKARIVLKQKQIQFWTNLSEQQRKSDLQKERQFKKIEANLILLEGKLRSKLAQLGKRQQKILTLEQELQSKIVQVSRQCLLKDQEIEAIKKRHKEDKASIVKQKAQIEVQLAKVRAQNARLKVENEQLRRQDQKAPLNILKSELNGKIFEIKQLSRQLQKANEVKQEYKIYYGKMKDQVISLREKQHHYQQSIHELRRQKDILLNNCKHIEQQLSYERQLYQQQIHKPYREEDDRDWENIPPTDERERMIRHKQYLIREANYSPNDPLILEIDRQIQALS